jgi:hypothetical protein
MTELRSNNQRLSKLMQKAKLEMPFSDFEETVMHRIHKETSTEQIVSTDRKLSFLFFVLGTIFGFVVNFLLQRSQYTFAHIPPETTLLIFQLGFVFIVLLQLDKYLRLIKKRKRQHQPG